MDQDRRLNLEGIASIALSGYLCQRDPTTIEATLRAYMATLSLDTRDDALLVADAIQHFPQPDDQPAEERERLRPIEDMVGLTPPEEQLAAQLRARELLLAIADTL